ncbi:mitochondrial distribution and morphology protein 10 [Pseudohyphozyma bogoriensis]|nr:mitochondrial distribution and morphology protein 10 [Pseudohyphozyma bogoriensis]
MASPSSAPAFVLRSFYDATNWSRDNHYAHLTRTSRQLLDFAPPAGLHLDLSHRPSSTFFSSLSLSTLVPSHPVAYPPSTAPVLGPPQNPLLAGSLNYVFSSAPLDRVSTRRREDEAHRVKLKELVLGFHPGALPVKPELRDDAQPTWLAGERVDKRDFLLFGRLYAPSPRLDALWVHRLSTTVQTLVSLISVPSPLPSTPLTWQNDNEAPPPSGPSGAAGRLSELEFKLQQDTGRWSTECSYAVGDGMWGAKGLWNFGKAGAGEVVVTGEEQDPSATRMERERVVDEEEEMSTGLKGRWSAGGEVYFSAQERSAGFSTGVRFATLPESGSNAVPSQPPTTITATLSPIMGQLSTAYCVATSPDSALASRFDFNIYSYDADVTFGGEWFQRRKPKPVVEASPEEGAAPSRASFDAFGRGIDESVVEPVKVDAAGGEGEITGVLKARMSTNTDLALMWEGRLGEFLVSLGVVADLRLATSSGGRTSPIRSVGFGVQYWG